MLSDNLWSGIRDLIPPVVTRLIRRSRLSKPRPASFGFSGDFSVWADATAVSSGYDDVAILEKVRQAAIAVKHGNAAFERDSVTFAEPATNWPVLASLMTLAAMAGGALHIVDFGGSLGSLYFQHRRFLDLLHDVSWTVIEQPHFVRIGQAELVDERLKFAECVPDIGQSQTATGLILSSVLQYLPDPHDMLRSLLNHSWDAVILDRTAFVSTRSCDRLTVQRVPPEIYSATYPAWFFSPGSLEQHFRERFSESARWICDDRYSLDQDQTSFEGRLFIARKSAQFNDQ